jgi:hypothetical protein
MKTFLVTILATILFLAAGVEAVTINAVLQWVDNSGTGWLHCGRAPTQNGTFVAIGNVGSNVVTFVDPSPQHDPILLSRQRSTRWDRAGSNVACLTTPSLPSEPGSVTVTVTLTLDKHRAVGR